MAQARNVQQQFGQLKEEIRGKINLKTLSSSSSV
jgi:hypothetical protein